MQSNLPNTSLNYSSTNRFIFWIPLSPTNDLQPSSTNPYTPMPPCTTLQYPQSIHYISKSCKSRVYHTSPSHHSPLQAFPPGTYPTSPSYHAHNFYPHHPNSTQTRAYILGRQLQDEPCLRPLTKPWNPYPLIQIKPRMDKISYVPTIFVWFSLTSRFLNKRVRTTPHKVLLIAPTYGYLIHQIHIVSNHIDLIS